MESLSWGFALGFVSAVVLGGMTAGMCVWAYMTEDRSKE